MSILALIGLVLVVLFAASLVTLVIRRRRQESAVAAGPRTVADLVRLRAEAATAESGAAPSQLRSATPAPAAGPITEPPADREVRSQSEESAPTGVATGPGPAMPVSEPAEAEPAQDVVRTVPPPVEAVARPVGALAEKVTRPVPEPARPDSEPAEVAAAPVQAPGEPATPDPRFPIVDADQACELDLTVDDAPWRRAAVLAAGHGGSGTWQPSADASTAPPLWLGPPASGTRAVAGGTDRGSERDGYSAPPVAAGTTAPRESAVRSAPAVGGQGGTARSRGGESVARRSRSAADRTAEHAAADLALLRTFGFADPGLRADSAPVVSMARADVEVAPRTTEGTRQPVRFRAMRRDGEAVGAAAVTLLDAGGSEVAGGTAGPDGHGEVQAPVPGSYVLVTVAEGHQPGALTITIGDAPTEVDVLLTRSASVSGSVKGEDGPVTGARVTLMQDGVIIDTVHTDADGTYRINDIGGGRYALTVGVAGREPIVTPVDVPAETDLWHDVDLAPATPAMDRTNDGMMSGRR